MERDWCVFALVCWIYWTRCIGEGCEDYEFRCANDECIRYMGRCDGRATCTDNSDEENCPTLPATTTTTGLPPHYHPCYDGSYQCANGRCIYKHWRCDGQDDCGDFSDESHCNGDDEGKVSKLPLNIESIIGITIAMIVLVLLVGGISAFMMYYRRRYSNGRHSESQEQRPDILGPIPGLPHNFPREALLREPPPMYTSQQDLSAHVNAGYHDDEVVRPPPCYSSNPDLSNALPMSNIIEPPPRYSSHQSLSVMDTTFNGSNHMERSRDSLPISGVEVIANVLKTDSKADITSEKSIGGSNRQQDWNGGKWPDVPKSLRKQKSFSVSDSNLVSGSSVNKGTDKETGSLQFGPQGVHRAVSPIVTISAQLDRSEESEVTAVRQDHSFPHPGFHNLPYRSFNSCPRISESDHNLRLSVSRNIEGTNTPTTECKSSITNQRPDSDKSVQNHNQSPSERLGNSQSLSRSTLSLGRGQAIYTHGHPAYTPPGGASDHVTVAQHPESRDQPGPDRNVSGLNKNISASLPVLAYYVNSTFLQNDTNSEFEC